METLDEATGKPEGSRPRKSRRLIPLTTLRHVRYEMAVVYRQMDRGKLENSEGTKRVFALRQIADVITLAEIESRIRRLEAGRPELLEAPRDDSDDDGDEIQAAQLANQAAA